MKLDDAIKMISQKTKKDTDLLKKEFEGVLNEVKKAMPDETEEIQLSIATNKLYRSYRKKMNSSGEEYTGVFTSIGGRFDMIKKRRAALQEEIDIVNEKFESISKESTAGFSEDGIKVHETEILSLKDTLSQMMNEEGELLFYETPEKQETMQTWQKKNLGTVMPVTDFKRSVNGVVIVDGKSIRFEMRLRNDNSTVIPKLFTNASFRGFKLENPSTETDYILNDSGIFTPEYGEELNESEVQGLFKKLYSDKMIDSTEIDAFQTAHSSEFSPMAIMKVDVVDISTNTTKNGSKIMTVADDGIPMDEVMICWIPEFFEFNFTDEATVYLVGTPKKDDKDKISIGVSGIFVPELYRAAVPETKDIDTDKW